MKTGLHQQSRRNFLVSAGTAACVSKFAMDAHSEAVGGNQQRPSASAVFTGNGEWTF